MQGIGDSLPDDGRLREVNVDDVKVIMMAVVRLVVVVMAVVVGGGGEDTGDGACRARVEQCRGRASWRAGRRAGGCLGAWVCVWGGGGGEVAAAAVVLGMVNG